MDNPTPDTPLTTLDLVDQANRAAYEGRPLEAEAWMMRLKWRTSFEELVAKTARRMAAKEKDPCNT